MRAGTVLAAALHVSFLALPLAAAPTYHLQPLPAAMVNTRDIANDGTAVGFNGNSPWRSYTWENGVFTPVPGVGNVSAVAVNDVGELAGAAGVNEFQMDAGMWGSDGTFVNFGIKGGALAINNHAQVVGGGGPFTDFHWAFIWNASDGYRFFLREPTSTILSGTSEGTDINDTGTVVGWGNPTSNTDGSQLAFLWSPFRGLVIMPGLTTGPRRHDTAFGINSAGQIVGQSEDSTETFHAVTWDVFGQVHDLGFTSKYYAEAREINDLGQVVGFTDQMPFFWENGQGYDLRDLIDNGQGWAIYNIMSINNSGQIVGSGFHPDYGFAPFILNPMQVPEPAWGGLMAICWLMGLRVRGASGIRASCRHIPGGRSI